MIESAKEYLVKISDEDMTGFVNFDNESMIKRVDMWSEYVERALKIAYLEGTLKYAPTNEINVIRNRINKLKEQ